MDIERRNNVTVTGNPQGPTVVLAHGFGCDQNMWRLTVPADLWADCRNSPAPDCRTPSQRQ